MLASFVVVFVAPVIRLCYGPRPMMNLHKCFSPCSIPRSRAAKAKTWLTGLVAIGLLAFTGACGSDGAGSANDTSGGLEDGSESDDIYIPPTPDGGGQFLPEITKEPSSRGGVCQRNEDCISNYCNTFPSGGYCTETCSGDNPCAEGASCVQDTDSDGQRRNLCLKTCTADYLCRPDQFCPTEVKLCVPRCQVDSCSTGYECNQRSGRCIPEAPCSPVPELCDGVDQDCNGYIDEGCGPPLASAPHVRVRDFGSVQVGGGGLSRTIAFTVGADVASFTVIAVPMDQDDTLLMLYNLKAPDGANLIGADNPLDGIVPTYPSLRAYTALVPNTDTYTVTPGRYSFALSAYGAGGGGAAPLGNAWIYVLENVRKGATASKLDINLWFVGVRGLSSGIAPTIQRFQDVLARLSTLMGNAGVTIGTVRYFDVSNADAEIYRIVDTQEGWAVDEHAELLTRSSALPAENRGVSFFLVEGFTGIPGSGNLLGKAGGVPGPPLLHGTYNSGVVVSMADYLFAANSDYGVRSTADTMAHELGHQLGLFHTSEGDGTRFDPVADTPECPASEYDKNRDGLIDANECLARDGNNMMFWTSAYDTRMTPGQRKVIHGNPVLQDP